MARIRTIKPEFFRHEGLQDLEAANRGAFVMLVFAGLWGHCDKAGRFEWRPRTLKLDILPFLEFDMAATMALLEGAGMVRKYRADGKEYGVIASFSEHQRIGGKEAQEPAKHPEPTENDLGSIGEALGKQQGLQEGKGREGKGRGREIDVGLSPDVAPLLPKKSTGLNTQALEVLAFLNEKTGRDYQPVPANLDLVAARLKEGATVEDCRMVIARKFREWGPDDKMRQYLRPATLFNAMKFAQYRGELVASPEPVERFV